MNVPAPERFAVHKLVVSGRRHADAAGIAKARKDVVQAGELIEALVMADRGHAVARSFDEAWGSGPTWRQLIDKGLARLGPSTKTALAGLELPAPILDLLAKPMPQSSDRDGPVALPTPQGARRRGGKGIAD